MTNQNLNLIWIDLEMTGLDPQKERIIEIATVVTDSELNVLAEGPSIAINQSNELIQAMDEWNTNQHGKSGLTDRVLNSAVTEAQAELATLDFLKQWVPEGVSPMCGNSIGQDRRFLVRYMPELANYFHYRNLDVSTLKELVRRWKPELINGFSKKGSHLAMDDVYDSIEELAYYRKVFIQPEPLFFGAVAV
jgi:oligoribonuclease